MSATALQIVEKVKATPLVNAQQEGTVFSRTSRGEGTTAPLDAEDYAQLRADFRENSGIRSADYIALNTFVPGD